MRHPTNIVSNPAASNPAVRNGLSCIGCHTEGIKTFEDEVRAVVLRQPDTGCEGTSVAAVCRATDDGYLCGGGHRTVSGGT